MWRGMWRNHVVYFRYHACYGLPGSAGGRGQSQELLHKALRIVTLPYLQVPSRPSRSRIRYDMIPRLDIAFGLSGGLRMRSVGFC
jgi:hypothetical protein